jgi:hypothetical protein
MPSMPIPDDRTVLLGACEDMSFAAETAPTSHCVYRCGNVSLGRHGENFTGPHRATSIRLPCSRTWTASFKPTLIGLALLLDSATFSFAWDTSMSSQWPR